MTYKEIINKVSEELDLPEEVVNKTYKAYWFSIKEIINDLPIKTTNSIEEFNKLKTNFNIPSLGKLSVTSDRFIGIKKRYEYIKKLKSR